MNWLNRDDVREGGSIFGLLVVFAVCFPLGWLLTTALTPWDNFWLSSAGTLVVIALWHYGYIWSQQWADKHL